MVRTMEQFATERVVSGVRPRKEDVTLSKGPVIVNQTYFTPKTRRALAALSSLEPYLAALPDGARVSPLKACRAKLMNADLSTLTVEGDLVFTNRSGPLFKGARELYVNALAMNLEQVRREYESGERFMPLRSRDIKQICHESMLDIVLGEKSSEIVDSRLVYGEPNRASQIDCVERRYHGVMRYSDNE